MAEEAGGPGGTGPGPDRARRRPAIHHAWVVIALVIGAAACLILLARLMAPERSDDLWVEVAKSSLQVAVLATAGGVVGAVLRDRDASREAARRRHDALIAYLERVETTYGQVRAGRRLLRALGFDVPGPAVLSDEQATGFRTQMALLSESQLALEMDARRVHLLADAFGPSGPAVERELLGVADYLHEVLVEWEKDTTVVAAGSDRAVLATWPRYLAFVGWDAASTGEFEGRVAGAMTRVEQQVLDAARPR